MASPTACTSNTNHKADTVCQKPPNPIFLATSNATFTQEQWKVDKAATDLCVKSNHESKNKEAAKPSATDAVDEKANKRDTGGILSPKPKKKKRSRHSKAPRESYDPAVSSPKRHRKRARIGEKKSIIEVSRDDTELLQDDIAPKVPVALITPLVSASPVSSTSPVIEAVQTAALSPDGEVGSLAAAVDMRRPSILKLPVKSKGWAPGLLYGTQGGAATTTAQRKSSTVGFDMAHRVDILGGEEREGREEEEVPRERAEKEQRTRFSVDLPLKGIKGADASPLTDCAGPSDKAVGMSSPTSPMSPATDEIRSAPRRRYSVTMCVASPSNGATADEQSAQRRSPFVRKTSATSSVTSAGRHGSIKDEKMASRLGLQMSQRTAFVLCCSLVTTTASLSSSLTMAARDTLVQHAVIKRGAPGLLTWLLLMTPTAVMGAAFCCVSLYVLHLRNRPPLNMEVNKDACLVATTELNKLGPIKHRDLLLPYALACFALFVCLSSMIGYNSGKHMLSFLSLLLLLFSVMPATRNGCCSYKGHMVVWSDMFRDMPWAVLLIHGTVQLTTSIVQSNKLLPASFALLGSDFWSRNSLVTNQAVIGAIGSVLAETVNNEQLSSNLVPLALQIALNNDVPGAAYAVPAAVGASSNMILPIELPMIVAHEVIEMPMVQIFFIGTIAKTVTVVISILSVNVYGSYLIPWTNPKSFNST